MIPQLIEKCRTYLQENVILGYVLIGTCALLVLTALILLITAPKRKQTRRQLRANAQAKAAQERAVQEHAEAQRKQEEAIATMQKAEQERIAKEKAEAQRLAAEKEEAERIAKEKADAEHLANSLAQQDRTEGKAIEQADAEAEAEEKAIMTLIEERTKRETEQQRKEKQKEKQKATVVKKEETGKKSEPVKKIDPLKLFKKPAPRQTFHPAPFEPEDDYTDKKGYQGKWTIYRIILNLEDDTKEEMYFFELRASNGEKLLSSEEYTTYAGAMRGIQTHKTNIERGNFKIVLSKKGDYIFKLLSGKNMLLCMGENYPSLARCESAVQSTKRFAKTAVIDDFVQTRTIKVLAEDDAELPPIPDGHNGKWIISAEENVLGEQVFYFELYANNGEKLISSEEYTTYVGAINGIQTHKTNIERNNFRISLTKRGDYIYKLLNGNGQLLSLGEHYKTKRLCQNAVESVRRFALNSPVLTDPKYMK